MLQNTSRQLTVTVNRTHICDATSLLLFDYRDSDEQLHQQYYFHGHCLGRILENGVPVNVTQLAVQWAIPAVYKPSPSSPPVILPPEQGEAPRMLLNIECTGV